MIQFLEVGGNPFDDEQAALLATAETLHRQLRPKIPAPYHHFLQTMFAEGARVALLVEHDAVRALAVWRVYQTTYAGKRFYIDDLVTDESVRGAGWGGKLIAWLQDRATALECDTFALDSGVQRDKAHRFYFRAGLVIKSFSFSKGLSDRF
jgi:GNAT superfamily N-acetyltransferase